MQDAIMYNTKAVSKMQSGEYEEAFTLLRHCMTNLTAALQASNTTHSKLLASPTKTSMDMTTSSCDTENDAFFSGAFLFTLVNDNEMNALPSREQVEHATATCLFNMALACHLEHQTCQDSRKRGLLMTQARTLYLTSYEILQKHAIQPSHPVVLLVMALCANLIDIEMELGRLDDVRFWREILLAASTTANPLCFYDSQVYAFFDTVYVPPGELVAAKAA